MTRKTKLALWSATLLFASWGIQNIWYIDLDAKLKSLDNAKARARTFVDQYTPIDYPKMFGPDSAVTEAQLTDRRMFARSLTAMAEPISDIPEVGPPLVALMWWASGQESPWSKQLQMPGAAIETIMGRFGWEYARVQCWRNGLRFVYIVLYCLAAILGITSTGLPATDHPRRTAVAATPQLRQDEGFAE